MLKRSELAIVKEGILTVNNYSFAMVYKMLAICSNPGTYAVNQDEIRKEYYFMSNGTSVWLSNKRNELVSGSVLTKFQLEDMLNKLKYATKNCKRYYEIDNILYREENNLLYYLIPKPGIEIDVIYTEHSIPMSIIFKVLKPDFPTKNNKESGIFSGRVDSIKEESVSYDYLDKYMNYFGYTKLDNYYVLLTFDDIIRIDTVENNKLKTFKVHLDSLKKVIII